MNQSSPYNQNNIRSFGRVRGRKLRVTKQSLVETLLPKIALVMPVETGIHAAKSANIGTWIPAFAGMTNIYLEIGFGQGEHLAMQAEKHPYVGFIGCEPFVNGIGQLLKHMDEKKLENIRIYTGDGRDVIDALPEASIGKCFILFPDPWPKARHHKRRLIHHEFLAALARVIKPNGELLIATDHEDYLTWILEQLQTQQDFIWTATQKSDWLSPPEDWVTTKYQAKAIREGRVPHWLRLVHVASAKEGE